MERAAFASPAKERPQNTMADPKDLFAVRINHIARDPRGGSLW